VPVPLLNNVATFDAYVDALTVVFPRGRAGFALNVANAAVSYQLAYIMPGDREPSWLTDERSLYPAFATFRDVKQEGLPDGSLFGGIRLRSFATATPARVTVN
jgi:hypothetical protein